MNILKAIKNLSIALITAVVMLAAPATMAIQTGQIYLDSSFTLSGGSTGENFNTFMNALFTNPNLTNPTGSTIGSCGNVSTSLVNTQFLHNCQFLTPGTVYNVICGTAPPNGTVPIVYVLPSGTFPSNNCKVILSSVVNYQLSYQAVIIVDNSNSVSQSNTVTVATASNSEFIDLPSGNVNVTGIMSTPGLLVQLSDVGQSFWTIPQCGIESGCTANTSQCAVTGNPTWTPGTAAGTGASVTFTGGNCSGTVVLTTGTSPASNAPLLTLSYAATWPFLPICSNLKASLSNTTNTGVTSIFTENPSTSSQVYQMGSSAVAASTVYTFYYNCTTIK